MARESIPIKLARRTFRGACRKAISRILPAVRMHLQAAHIRGRLHARIGRVPDHVLENMRSALGETHTAREIDDLARRYIEYSKQAYLARILPYLRDFDNAELWPVQGLEHLDKALGEERGVVLLTGHYGYGRLIAPILRVHGYEVLQLARPKPNLKDLGTGRSKSQALGLARTLIGSLGTHDIPADLDVRPIIQALADKRILLALGDGKRAHAFLRLSLLGRPYPFPTGIMKIAMMTSAAVLPVFALDGDRRNPIRLEIHPALSSGPAADVATSLQEFAQVFDRQLRNRPDLYNRWKHRKWFETALKRAEARAGNEQHLGARG
ncbi:MAG: lysophospholipid acyltransferase family protein [Gemmatimonadota bacterium]